MRKVRRHFYNFFVPHEGNNYRAHSLHHNFLGLYLVIAFFFFAITYSGSLRGGQILGIATDVTIQKLYELTNQERQKNNLSTLTLSDTLSQAAVDKAQDMFAHDYWAHYSPEGTAPWDFFKKEGYNYEYAGENLAKNFLYSQNVVDAWMASPGHRENILKPEYSQVGYAVVNGKLNGEDTTLVVQFFGRPLGVAEQEAQAPQKQIPQVIPQPTSDVPHAPQVLPATRVNLFASFSTNPLALSTFFILFLITALVIDLYFAAHLKVFRLHGKNVAHVMFLIFFLTGLVLFISRGTIL